MSKRKKILIALFLVFLIIPVYSTMAKGALSPDAQMCIGCHSNKDLTKQLENKETLSLYVNGDEFANSVHNPTSCAGCHTDISMANHPQVKKVASKKEYSANASKSCSMCHPNEMLKKKPMHGYVITQPKAPACAECHGAHSIKRIADWKARISEEHYCLTCHKPDLSMRLGSGETLSLSVNESDLKKSVHKGIQCSVCHTGFSKTEHPYRTFKTKRDFTATVSKSCTMCHTDAQLKKKPIHADLITAAKATTCVECHGSHSIKRMSELKPTVKENQYCLTCHKHKLSMPLKSGESLSLSVDESVIRKSVHDKLQCSACHIGFSKTEHPKRVFESKRKYSVSASDMCKKCHENANKLYEESIHLSQLKSGNLKSSTCTDCHGSHSMAKATTDKTLGILSCNKCHGEINNVYKTSVHGEALTKTKENAPTCSSCHNAHDVKVTARTTKMKDACLKCHKDADNLHKKWLSNPPIKLSSFAGLHLDTIACATCHSPRAGGGVYLTLYDKKTGYPFPEEKVLKLLKTDSAGLVKKIDTNEDGNVDAREVWNFTQRLKRKGADVTLRAIMDVRTGIEAHQLTAKAKAVKECEKCHQADSHFFKNVYIVLSKADGKPTLYTAEQGVLNSPFSVLPVNQFYVLGSTNIKLLDILFIIVVIGGLCVPIGHITLRIITKPIRHLRKMGKGVKK